MKEIINHLNLVIPIVGGCAFLVLSGAIWALNQIRGELKKEFVTKTECSNCKEHIQEVFHKDIDTKYSDVLDRIDKNHDDWTKELKDMQKDAQERNDRLVSIDTKVDMILKGIIKYE